MGDAAEVGALLEGAGGAEGERALLAALAAAREPWVARGLLHYHARTGSARALDLLARAPDHHARFLLDHLHDLLRGDRPQRRAALAALAPLVARRPAWLHRLPPHPVARDLVRAARLERDPLPLLYALLALAALLPAAPGLAAPHWPDLADALLRPAVLEPPPSPATRAHLQLAQLALFHALYATHPCTLLDTLRAELGTASARDAWERSLAPLLHSVRLHPALVTGSRAREADAARWARLELHDVVAETRRLSLHTPERTDEPAPSPAPAAPPSPVEPPAGSGAHASRAAATLRPGLEPWFPLAERCGADSAPHTPLPPDPDATEPPEAAVEATPENTPAKETRAQFRFPTESAAVRAIGRKETSPPVTGGGDAYTSRISRVMAERRAADSPVAFAGAPPACVARPEPLGAREEPLNVEDREVLELTARGRCAAAEGWGEEGWGGAGADPRRLGPLRLGPPEPRPPASPPRRAASCSPHRGARSICVAVQTVDAWPEPYEFLIADFYRHLPDDPRKQSGPESRDAALPCERLDQYLAELYCGGGNGTGPAHGEQLAEQLALVHAQLMYERWRREAHAERNRRLLGRCRAARALELQAQALRDRVRALTRERDELAARLQRPPPPAPPPPAAAEHEARLEAALRAEKDARARAEARLHEVEALRERDAAELQRARGESFEAARHVEALARAAASAERSEEHVRCLRRELLMLTERETRLSDAARSGAQASAGGGARAESEATARALRAAVVKAEAEAAAATTRAEAATARVHELEAALGARDAALAELKRATRHAAEEHAARLRAAHDKYEALMRVLRAAETRRLERLADVPAPHTAHTVQTAHTAQIAHTAAAPHTADSS